MSDNRPQTVEEFAALPVGPIIAEDRIIDGQKVTMPVMPKVMAIYHNETDLISYLDDDGSVWTLGRYTDGRWFRWRA
jgi:hypothetical protein